MAGGGFGINMSNVSPYGGAQSAGSSGATGGGGSWAPSSQLSAQPQAQPQAQFQGANPFQQSSFSHTGIPGATLDNPTARPGMRGTGKFNQMARGGAFGSDHYGNYFNQGASQPMQQMGGGMMGQQGQQGALPQPGQRSGMGYANWLGTQGPGVNRGNALGFGGAARQQPYQSAYNQSAYGNPYGSWYRG